ncbi:MAG: N-6 DNA methylase [Chloroflexi bacterium]|nr:N-6 DNA methylase [Chloroflexota bacterium]
MINSQYLQRAIELGIVAINEKRDIVTYRLGRERRYTWSDPEELVRAELILELLFDYSYSPKRMLTEVPIPGRSPTIYADIVVFADERRSDPYITCEVASTSTNPSTRSQKIEQLFGYANALASKYAVYFDGKSTKTCWSLVGHGGLERTKNLINDIPSNYGSTPAYTFVQGSGRDIEAVTGDVLLRVFDKCHSILWSGGKLDPSEAFDEMSKIMFAKLDDERRTSNGMAYRLQWGSYETDIMVADRVVESYNLAREYDTGVFTEDIRSEPHKIAAVVAQLQHISLEQTDPDAKGRAFEQFLGDVFRGKLGQYFTRRELVDFLVSIVSPELNDVILDPACGSGGFLIYSLKKIFSEIESRYQGNPQNIFRHKSEFANNNVYGIEINEKIARVSMMDMVVNDDGHTNIQIASALSNSFANDRVTDGRFTLVLTNPPFGDKVERGDIDKLGTAELDDFVLSKNKSKVNSEILFLERCERFLCPGGRLGIVVPDGILSNPSQDYVREFLLTKFKILAVVKLPTFAFRASGSGIGTSLLFARKWRQWEPATQDYDIFMAIADQIGYDSTARPDDNELPSILSHFENGTGNLNDRVIRVPRSQVMGKMRLDVPYYYLEPIIEKEFSYIEEPIYTLSEVAGASLSSGKSPKGGATYSFGPVPIILIGDIDADGAINTRNLNTVPEAFFEDNKAKGSVRSLDILVAKDGATTGKVGMIPDDFEFERCLINEHIFKFSVGSVLPGDEDYSCDIEESDAKRINTLYVFFYLKSRLGQRQFDREISGGAQGGITRKFVENIRIPIPPPSARRTIVERSEREYRRYLELARNAGAQYESFNRSLYYSSDWD